MVGCHNKYFKNKALRCHNKHFKNQALIPAIDLKFLQEFVIILVVLLRQYYTFCSIHSCEGFDIYTIHVTSD